jgi:dihydrofolate reductase
MRNFKLQVQMSVDGYMAGPNGEMDWMNGPWSDDLATFISSLYEGVDTLVLGRKLAEGFIPHWASRPSYELDTAIDTMNNTAKVVISDTLTTSPWDNTVVSAGDLTTTINNLKAQPGGNIITFGGGTLVRSLIANGLLDDLYLFVNPTAIGSGMAVFDNVGSNQPFRRVTSRAFACGVTVLHLQPEHS